MSQNENTKIVYLFERAGGTDLFAGCITESNNHIEADFKTELLLAFEVMSYSRAVQKFQHGLIENIFKLNEGFSKVIILLTGLSSFETNSLRAKYKKRQTCTSVLSSSTAQIGFLVDSSERKLTTHQSRVKKRVSRLCRNTLWYLLG